MYTVTKVPRRVLLDLEGLKVGKPELSSLYYASPLVPGIFTLAPFMFLIGPRLGAGLSLAIVVFTVFSMIAFLRMLTYVKKNPLGFNILKIVSLSSRTFYLGAILWAELASFPRIILIFVAALWLFSELISRHIVRKLSDQQVEFTFEKSFKRDKSGDILYNPVEERPETHFDSSKRGAVLWVVEVLPAICLGVLAPYLYLKSFLLRDNLEPRFMIVFAFTLAFAAMTRTVTTEYYLVRRALKLKADEV